MTKTEMFFGGVFTGAGIASMGFGGYYAAYLAFILAASVVFYARHNN